MLQGCYPDGKGGALDQTSPRREKCCDRDHNGDGDCDRHPSQLSQGEPDAWLGIYYADGLVNFTRSNTEKDTLEREAMWWNEPSRGYTSEIIPIYRNPKYSVADAIGGKICPSHGRAVLVTHIDDGEPCTDYLLSEEK